MWYQYTYHLKVKTQNDLSSSMDSNHRTTQSDQIGNIKSIIDSSEKQRIIRKSNALAGRKNTNGSPIPFDVLQRLTQYSPSEDDAESPV